MHYIAELYQRTVQSRSSPPPMITLRGYRQETWVDSEMLSLPVHALAYGFCPTFRDVYLEWGQGRARQVTWEGYRGLVIDKLYKLIHQRCQEYASNTPPRSFDLFDYMMSAQDELVNQAVDKYKSKLKQVIPEPSKEQLEAFEQGLRKIARFEGEITSSFIDFEIARLQSTNPGTIFSEYFDFTTDLQLRAKNQGFNTPATPDFIYRHQVIGDIKSGSWQKFFEYTVVAYALAYEEHTHRDMDYGAILHVQLPENRKVPAHYEGDIIYLDDSKRKRFLIMRENKLQIITGKIDPGKPPNNQGCTGCSLYSECWSDTSG